MQPTATPDPAKIVYESGRIVVTLEDNSHDSVLAQEQIRIAVKDAARYVLVTDPSQAPADGREALVVETLIRKVSRDHQTPYNHYGVYLDMAELTEKYLNEYSLKPAEGVIKTVVFNDDGSLTCTVREEYAYSEYDFDTHYWVNYVHLRSLADDAMETFVFEKQFASGKAPRLLRTLNGSYPDLQLVNRHLMYFDGYAYLCLGLRYKAAPLENTYLRVTAINGVPGNYGQFDFIPEVEDGMERSSAAIRLDGLSENAAVFTVEAVSNTDQRVIFRTDLTVEGMTPPAPTATPTPAPTATPNPKAIVFEDDRVVVTLDDWWNDRFFINGQMNIFLREPDRYVLVTDPAQAAADPREAILVGVRQECVTTNMTSGLKSFTIGANSSSERLLNELEKSPYYHITCLDTTSQLLPDGSLRLITRGDFTAMRNKYDDGMTILTALSFTTLEGEGRTEVFYRTIPSAAKARRTVTYKSQGYLNGLKLDGGSMYYDDNGAWLSIKYSGNIPAGDVTLNCLDQPAWFGITTTPIHRVEEIIRYTLYYPETITSEYDHLIFRLDGLDSLTDVLYPALTFPDGRTLQLVSQRVGDINGPTATPAPSTTPAPSATPHPEGTPAIPPDAEITDRYTLDVAEKTQKYSHYNATLLATSGGYILQPTFRYHDPLPEGTMLRLITCNGIRMDGAEALIGPANLSSGPADLLSARIALWTLPETKCTFFLEAIHPDTGEPIFALTLRTREAVKPVEYRYDWLYDVWIDNEGNVAPPVVTPYVPSLGNFGNSGSFPFKDAIEDGFNLNPTIDYGFGLGW